MLNQVKRNGQSNPSHVARLLTAAILAVASLSATSPISNAQDATAAGEPAAPPARNRDPGGLMDHAAQSGAQVFVDDSFASVEKLREAMRYASQGQAQLAITKLQEIVNDYGQKLVFLNDNSYVSITDYVREKLLQLPAVKQGMYDQLYGGEAKKAVDTAISRHDLAGLIHACDRYYPSSAALAGLSQAAEWYFERGEFSSAARTWKELLVHPMAAKLQPEFLFRAAAAESLAQDGPAAKQLRDRLAKEFPAATATLQGKEEILLSRLDEIRAMPPWDSVDLSREEWPAFEGGPDRSKRMNVSAIIGARLWGVPFSDESDVSITATVNPQVRQLQQAQMQANGIDMTSPMLNSFAVLSNGTLFVHTGERILALSANAGTLLWSYPQQVIPRVDAAAQIRLRNTLGASVRPNGHDSVSVVGDQVFAVLPAPFNPRAGAARQADALGNPLTNSRVVCLNRNDAQELWSTSTDDVKLDSPGALTFVGSPTVTRQGVFVMARKTADASFTQQYLVRLDRDTGAVTWVCYLCSTSSGAMYSNQYVGIGAIPVPTVVDDIVYICTGQGADCAIDANAGRILWLHTADGGAANRGVAQFTNPNIIYVPAWKFNPPVIAGDKMITCDNTLLLRVYDRWAGKLLTTIDCSSLDIPKVDVLAGVVGSRLILSGGYRSLAINLDAVDWTLPINDALKPEWTAQIASEAGTPQGRPFLTTKYYYVPFNNKLVRIDLDTGKSELWDWPKTEKDTDGKPGNLLVTSEQVIVVNDAEIAGYSKWETARDNRLAKIKANPSDPDAYLALAEISFRTNHQDLARENMKKSIDLANAGDGAAGRRPMAEILTRLYQTNLNFSEQLLPKSDSALRDQARFYYEQCRSSARTPEQQAQWRLRLAELSLKQKKLDEAATLYSEVLADPALRAAGYHESDVVASAGASAEQKLHKLIIDNGLAVYSRFEDQAAALLKTAQAQRDLPGLQQVMEGYPNSAASIAAATDLAAAYRDKKEWENARKILWWLEPRAKDSAQATAIADLVSVSIGLKKYPSAAAWAARGARQYKDLAFNSAFGEKLTFADIRKQVAALGLPGGEGRLPLWYGASEKAPVMDATPLDNANVIAGTLLVPIEPSSSLRQPNLFFLQKREGDSISVYESATGTRDGDPIHLPQNAPAVLLGATPDTALFLQARGAIGVDLKTHKMWSIELPAPPAAAGVANAPNLPGQPNQIIRINGANGINQIVIVNGQQVVIGAGGTFALDANGNAVQQNAGDPEMVRRAAFATLQRPNFTTARILNGRLILVAGNQLSAFDIQTGRPAWHDRAGAAITLTLPPGQPTAVVGNEDILAIQVDNGSSTFYVVDADTGKFRKQFKLSAEQASWRAIGDDGTLFVVTDQSVSSFDLLGDQNRPLWRRSDIQTRYASATALTLDGLILVDNASNVMCLSLESGEMRWPALVSLTQSPLNAGSLLRSTVEGDRVIFQHAQGIVAVRTYLSDEGQIAWVGTVPPNTPPLQSLQMSDPYLIEFAAGPVTTSQLAVKFIFRSPVGGKLDHAEQLIKGPGSIDGPQIRSWQVLDAGIAFDIAGEVHFWRNKPNPTP